MSESTIGQITFLLIGITVAAVTHWHWRGNFFGACAIAAAVSLGLFFGVWVWYDGLRHVHYMPLAAIPGFLLALGIAVVVGIPFVSWRSRGKKP